MFIILSIASLMAIFLSLINREIAIIIEIVSVIFAFRFVAKEQLSWQKLVVVIINIFAIIFLLYNFSQLYGDKKVESIDNSIYLEKRKENDATKVFLPIIVKQQPIKSLILINFLPNQDDVYKAFEPQIIQQNQEYFLRILAYRNDGYIDVYDNLNDKENLNISAAEEGLGMYISTDFDDYIFEIKDGYLVVDIQWTDADNRLISIQLEEGAMGKIHHSVGLDLLAPAGVGSSKPSYFPFFIMNDFDFFRTQGSVLDIRIDNRQIEVEDFPVPFPIQSEKRNYIRYTMNAEIYEVFPNSYNELLYLEKIPGSSTVQYEDNIYLFENDKLSRIKCNDVEWHFSPALDIGNTSQGELHMRAYADRAYIHATYQVEVIQENSYLEIAIDDVKMSQHRDIYERLIFNNIKLFSEWPKAYVYKAYYNLVTGEIESEWKNFSIEQAE